MDFTSRFTFCVLTFLAQSVTSLQVTFTRPTVVHKSYNLQHAWFSSLASLQVTPSDHLLLSFSLGGDGTACPPPGKPKSFQNCSMTVLSNNGGQSWTPLPNWSKHSFNTIVPLSTGSFVSIGYGLKFIDARNTTAVQSGWQGHIDSTTGTLIIDTSFNITFRNDLNAFPIVLVHSGSVVKTTKGYITTLYGHGPGVYRHWTSHPTVYVVESTDLKDWSVISSIPWESSFGNSSDGPGEPSTTRLSDNRLLMVIRIDGDAPYWKSFSSDDGHSWTVPVRMVSPTGLGQWSVKPRVRQVPGTNLLVLLGGRPGLNLWVSQDFGNTWIRYNIAKEHNNQLQQHQAIEHNNQLQQHQGVQQRTTQNITELLYTHEVVDCTNWTAPRANPPQTSSYFGATFARDGALVLSYDRLSDGWHGAHINGTWGSFDTMFTMRVFLQDK